MDKPDMDKSGDSRKCNISDFRITYLMFSIYIKTKVKSIIKFLKGAKL